jgi:aspartate aminotransferase-like enzyme
MIVSLFQHLPDAACRKVLYTTKGQPFLIAGSGTLGWDQVAANLVGKDLH